MDIHHLQPVDEDTIHRLRLRLNGRCRSLQTRIVYSLLVKAIRQHPAGPQAFEILWGPANSSRPAGQVTSRERPPQARNAGGLLTGETILLIHTDGFSFDSADARWLISGEREARLSFHEATISHTNVIRDTISPAEIAAK
jgi:hypothetical protein